MSAVLPSLAERLDDTATAFDSVAATYDGPQGNNDLIQRMRDIVWRTIDTHVPAGSRVLDIGCGTGIDAAHLAARGDDVLATDWSPEMVARTADRIPAVTDAGGRIVARRLGVQELGRLVDDRLRLDAAISNFGPLNCDPDPRATAEVLARLLEPGGHLVFSVIGRACPWEFVHYVLRGRLTRARVRFQRGPTPVGMNGHTIWTRYYWPREFTRHYEPDFEVVHREALSLFVPPPYLTFTADRLPRLHRTLVRLDELVAARPVARELGDHFLVVLRRR